MKRIRRKYPYAPEHMTSSELNLWLQKNNDQLFETYMANSLMVPEEKQPSFDSNLNLDQLFKKPDLPTREKPVLKREAEIPVKIQTGISNKSKTLEGEVKEKKGEKGKKIAKKSEIKLNSIEEYRPKPPKKLLKSEPK